MAYTNIDDPSAYFQTTLYAGTGSAQSITNDGNSDLQPDWIWIKRRDGSADHNCFDSSRGAGAHLAQNQTQAEQTVNGVTAFNSDGFTLSTNGDSNYNTGTFAAWQWKANGGTTSSNTAGGTTTTVQANQDAGFSILTWTGNGATTTLGHGLGVEPEVIIQKARGTTSNWAVYHKDAGPAVSQASYNVATYLNLSDATGIASNSWGTAPSDINSNTFYLKYWFNYNTTNVAYCFASRQGYSKFGSYIGNGFERGPFVYTGFRPAFIMTKRADGTSGWFMQDIKRGIKNQDTNTPVLQANGNFSETDVGFTNYEIDFLSNGFKLRDSNLYVNASGSPYIYMAFAENPFVTSTGTPATAR